MSQQHPLLLATADPQELVDLLLDAAVTHIAPGESRVRRGFQIALDAVSTPAGADGRRRSRAGDGRELVEQLLDAAVEKVAPHDKDTRAGVEVALAAVLSIDEQPAATVLAERFAAASQ